MFKLFFTPLEKAADSCRWYRSFLRDGGLMPPSLVVRKHSSLTGHAGLKNLSKSFLYYYTLTKTVSLRLIILLLIVQINSFSVQAAEQEIPAKNDGTVSEDAMNEESDMEALMSILDEETEIATKTKMNSDYVPGMVTVLNGEDLELLGIQTVWEALSLVPGIQLTRIIDGSPLGNRARASISF